VFSAAAVGVAFWYSTVTLARRMHRRLVRMLGGRCALCGTRHRLEIDHPRGRRVGNRTVRLRVNFTTRVRRYWLEYARGVRLRPLCRNCNARDGGGRRIRRAA
jgi:hypothetical protein